MKKTLIIIVTILALYSCEREVYNELALEDFPEYPPPSPLSSSSSSSMKSTIGTITVMGTYYWELVFDYDNTGNSATFIHKHTIVESKKFHSRAFAKEKFNLTSGYKLEAKTSVDLKFLKSSGSGSLSYSFHSELATELEKTYEETLDYEYTSTIEKTYNIGPGSKATLYQLMFKSDFGTYATRTISTFPKPVEYVYLDFELNEEILGLEDMLDNVLLTTSPGRGNIGEWAEIRDNIVRYSSYDDHTRLYQLLSTLKTISPSRDNILEWAAIRTTSTEILNNWNTINRNSLYRQLLARFRDTNPWRDNTLEWANIRAEATSIYNTTIQIW